MWTDKLLSPANIERFLVVPDDFHVKGCKLKAVKKRPSSPPSSERPMKCPRQTEGDTPTSLPIEDVEGATFDVNLYRTRDFGIEPTLGREMSNTTTLLPAVGPKISSFV